MSLPEVRKEGHVDVLSDVLRTVRLTGAIFFDVEASAPWVAATPAATKIAGSVMPDVGHIIMFHVITAGECWAELEDGTQEPLRLTAGDIIVLPMGDAHVFSTAPGMRVTPNLAMYQRPSDRQLPSYIETGAAGGARTRFVCGYLGCDARPFNPVLQALPRVLHARGAEGAPCMAQLIRLAVDETASRRSGGETVLSKVAELMFVDVVRRHIDTLPKGAGGWLSGLRDPHVGAALALMHGRPAKAWTLERLAHEVGLSRSAFADRFAHFVQDSPMQYLTRWRMQLATRLLEQQGLGLAQVAAEVGYESEAAFNRAFKKCVGAPPGAWRRARQPAEQGAVANKAANVQHET
jgi:AraC-like DNA-binding protein